MSLFKNDHIEGLISENNTFENTFDFKWVKMYLIL